ncbi:MAG: site-specific DNA-methyltransferase [Deltaproteobacteria bacterium]|jgi:adenine-specific DNA-methyltransferase
MPSAEQLRSRLLKKIKELFQLDQPDLDFGFYRIMHAKAQHVQDFIDKDLLKIVADAFGQVDDIRKGELQVAYDKAIQTAGDYGAAVPEETEPVKKARAALDSIKDAASHEGEIYDHLYRFFERYYDDGDFISRRYYTRETVGKAAPFAIPYNGEEVKLHWANADQYYIKTTEYFSNFTFDLLQAKEVKAADSGLLAIVEQKDKTCKVHFKITEAAEGEHGNVKASEANKRFFIINTEKPVEVTKDGELVVNFEYRPDPEKSGQENTWRDKRNAESVEKILSQIEELVRADGEHGNALSEYLRLLKSPAPTESDKKRPVLAKYINQYTARNTMDYFIHKDLGGFLRRELDFYIKNEVMRLDDIENAEAPAVETYLSKIKVLRKISGKLIDFLAQLEDFQKKLWLKKKFVVETNYCITLDRVPEELYPEIAANEAQHDEWVRLFAIDEIDADITDPGYTKPLTVEFLKANNKLMLDTRFFDEVFKGRLIASIENFDEQCDGLLIHSENLQAINTISPRYGNSVDIVFADPPYNTGVDGFPYKDSYQHASWLSMMENRLVCLKSPMSCYGLIFLTIDFVEVSRLRILCDEIFGAENFLADIAWEKRYTRSNNAKRFYSLKDTVLCYRASPDIDFIREDRSEKSKGNYTNPDNDHRGLWISSSYVNPAMKEQRPNLVYTIHNPITGKTVNHPTHAWKYEPEVHRKHIADNRLYWGSDGSNEFPRLKTFLSEASEGMVPIDVWHHKDTGTTDDGGKALKALFGVVVFDNPKPPSLVQRAITLSPTEPDALMAMDHFAGSGTTGHAVINLNREDSGTRKYILVEMGDYFDTVLKPRIVKVVYSSDWKDGKPTSRHTGISHCFKYLRLESYEDTLNNLQFDESPTRNKVLAANASLKEDYMLRYLLDVETRGSQSLLNIDAFADPTAYTLQVKKPGSDEYFTRNVDIIETFHYLIGLRVGHIAVSQTFNAAFKRILDPELPEDQRTKLLVDGKIRQDAEGPWWFRKIEGWVPKDIANPNNGQREKVLIVWRKLTGDLEKDNLMLDEWFQKNRISTRDFEFDTIYVNGSNNLPNLLQEGDTWKVRLIEEEFMKRMWDVESA